MSTTAPSLHTHKIRSRPSAGPLQSSNPATPLSRSVSGLYGSPGSSFRIDDENLLIFEIGSRVLRAGFAGESAPRCLVRYEPGLWRRVGDYREYQVGYQRGAQGMKGYELWEGLDARDLDLGLVEDRVETVIREAEQKFLLLDNRAKRVALTVPSDLPRPLVSLLLRRLFEGLGAASVTLLPSSVMACLGAGVRTAIVVDMGWFDTTITAVSEYRVVRSARTVRAGKMMVRRLRKRLQDELGKQGKDHKVSFEDAEEVLCRMAWCRQAAAEPRTSRVALPSFAKNNEAPPRIPFESLADSAESTFLASNDSTHDMDTHNQTLPHLLFQTLLKLPVDIRNLCLSHIIFTGGLSNIPGLNSRIISELQILINNRGWDPIHSYGTHLSPSRRRGSPGLRPTTSTSQPTSPPFLKVTESTTSPPVEDPLPRIPAHLQPHDTNPIDTKLSSLALSNTPQTPPAGTVRAIDTLGAWAGASLLTNLRIKGVVEIERERFMTHGLVGGALPPGVGAKAVEGPGRGRMSMGLGLGGKGPDKNTGWNLGVWA